MKIFFLIFLIFITLHSYAIPAFPEFINFIQPDSQTVRIKIMGDEKIRWAETEDAYTLLFDENAYYCYAFINENGDLTPSKYHAKTKEKRNQEEQEFLLRTQTRLNYNDQQKQLLHAIYTVKNEEMQKSFPPNGNRKLLMILIDFTDKPFIKTQLDFYNLMNQTNYSINSAYGSVKDWFKANSFNQLILSTDIAGPYHAENTMAYYGANLNGSDQRPRELVTEAVILADAEVNYANYDNDNDGSVDGVYIIYAGYGEEAGGGANTIWAHAWAIPTITLDGKNISRYSCSAELSGNSGSYMTNIGVICHEFSHVCGLPDFYDTDYANSGGQAFDLENWDPMASGSWNDSGRRPPYHNAYSKIYLNWQTQNILNTSQNISLLNSAENNISYRFNTNTDNEYFLLENRQKIAWDYYVPAHGLLIYHIDENWAGWLNNKINATPSHQGMDIEEADNTQTEESISGDPFPGSNNIRSFTDNNSPNSKSWNGVNTAKPIYNIIESNGAITFDFMGVETEVLISNFPYEEGFETSFLPFGWQIIDNDNDGFSWFEYSTQNTAHSGIKSAASASWNSSAGALHPDNWLITPKICLPEIEANQNIKLSFWICAQDASWSAEHYSLLISNSENNLDSFTDLFSETLNSNVWIKKEYILNDYSLQDIYLAIRHHEVSDMFYIKFDDIRIEILNDDTTLPVTLSSFTANYTASNIVNVKWDTESETSLLGYLIYRNITSEFNNALLITNEIIPSHNSSNDQHYLYSDEEINPNTEYYYWLQSINNDGSTLMYGPIFIKTIYEGPDNPPLLLNTCLKSAYPNPFSPSTTISYELAEDDFIQIEIFNIKGQKVKNLINKRQGPGQYTCVWNGKDERNNKCRAGVYFYSMKAKNYSKIHKVILMK